MPRYIVFVLIAFSLANVAFATTTEAPSELSVEDVPNDNGHWIIVKFIPPESGSAPYPLYTYQSIEGVNDSIWVYTTQVDVVGLINEEGFFSAVISTPINGDYWWRIGNSNIYLGGAIDNKPPSPFTAINTQIKENYEVILNWEVPEDHGVVGSFGGSGMISQQKIYGVDKYEIYRQHNDDENFVLLGNVDRTTLSYTDSNIDKSGVYEYYVKAVDGNPEHNVSIEIQTINIQLPPKVLIDGNVVQENKTDNAGTKVVFERVAPTACIDSTITDSEGYYSIELFEGIYNITYSKPNYVSQFLDGKALYSPETLPSIILDEKPTLLNVPADIPSIQSAINVAAEGDTVLVAPGTYYENIDFFGKGVIVASEYYLTGERIRIYETIINGSMSDRCVEFCNSETNQSKLIGFTITNGWAGGGGIFGNGGGIYIDGSNPHLESLIISQNYAKQAGGGIYIKSKSTASIRNIILHDNVSDQQGGGIFIYDSSPKVNTILLHDNRSRDGGGIGLLGSPCRISNATIYSNYADRGGGISNYSEEEVPQVVNSLIANNYGDCGVYVINGSISITYSNMFGNEGGVIKAIDALPQYFGDIMTTNANGDSCDAYQNIFINPRFVDPDNGDFHLLDYSPCIGAGTPENAPTIDIEGNPRGTPPDIGAYENALNSPILIHPPAIITISLSDATQDVPYSETILVEDPDEGDSFTFQFLEAPEWLSIDNSGILSGTPDNDDVGSDIPISITVTDAYGLTDTFQTNINVINVNDPPEIVTTELSDAVEGVSYSDTLEVNDPDIGDSLLYQIIEGPSWMVINAESGILSGTPSNEDVVEAIPISIAVEYAGGLSDTFQTTINVIANPPIYVDEDISAEFQVHSLYPNPFNPTTTITYTLPELAQVTLYVYSASGQKVATLIDGVRDTGTHSVVFDGTGLTSGAYFYRLESSGYTATGKMLLMK